MKWAEAADANADAGADTDADIKAVQRVHHQKSNFLLVHQ